jgi:hypothetical protein
MDLGLFVGTHSTSAYPTDWSGTEEVLTRHAAVVGVQAEQRFGSAVTGLRVGFLGNYALSVSAEDRLSEYRLGLMGAHARVFGALRKNLLTGLVSAQAGIALACDYYRVTSRSKTRMVTGALTQSMTAGLRVRPCGRVTAGVDLDLAHRRFVWGESTWPSVVTCCQSGSCSACRG